MLTIAQVTVLVNTMVANDLTSLKVKGSDYAVRMRRPSHAAPQGRASRRKPAPVRALSPATGAFFCRGADDGLPELTIGAQVLANEPLGYVGIGPFRVLCVSPATGRVTGELPTPKEPISIGDPLFTVEPTG